MANKTRELILDAFITLARRNPQRTSFTMTEIAAEAGISRQAIYQKHFNNFEDTFNMSFAEVKKNMKPRVIATSCFTILEEYLTTHPKLKSVVKGRNLVVD